MPAVFMLTLIIFLNASWNTGPESSFADSNLDAKYCQQEYEKCRKQCEMDDEKWNEAWRLGRDSGLKRGALMMYSEMVRDEIRGYESEDSKQIKACFDADSGIDQCLREIIEEDLKNLTRPTE